MKKQDQSEEQLRCLNDNLLNTMLYQLRIEVDGRRQFTYVSEGVRPLHGCSPDRPWLMSPVSTGVFTKKTGNVCTTKKNLP